LKKSSVVTPMSDDIKKLRDTEKFFLENGYVVCGVDESGVSCYAGPITVCGAVLSKLILTSPALQYVCDCKTIKTDEKLKEHYDQILPYIDLFIVKHIPVDTIDASKNLLGLIKNYMTSIVKALEPEVVFVDHHVLPIRKPQFPISKGDSIFLSVAAASIIAKYHRDTLMIELDQQFPQYNWKSNKGGVCPAHYDLIVKYGVTPHHRRKFLKRYYQEVMLNNK
jgi:ribonuclease HII